MCLKYTLVNFVKGVYFVRAGWRLEKVVASWASREQVATGERPASVLRG